MAITKAVIGAAKALGIAPQAAQNLKDKVKIGGQGVMDGLMSKTSAPSNARNRMSLQDAKDNMGKTAGQAKDLTASGTKTSHDAGNDMMKDMRALIGDQMRMQTEMGLLKSLASMNKGVAKQIEEVGKALNGGQA